MQRNFSPVGIKMFHIDRKILNTRNRTYKVLSVRKPVYVWSLQGLSSEGESCVVP